MATEAPGASFAGFLCWDPKVVNKVINPEAASPSIDVLLATHQSVPLKRVGLPEAGRWKELGTVTEDEVLAAVRDEAGGPLIVPVIGPSGSGKSHFVLWLRAQLESRDEPWRRVVYIPKSDLHLAGVIDRILMQEEGEEFDRLKKAVKEATTSLDANTATVRLRNAIAVAVSGLTADGDEAMEVVIDGLPALLSDPNYEPHLLAEGGAFAQAAAAALGEASEVEARFDTGDLPMVSADVQEDLSLNAKTFLKRLGSSAVRAKTYEVLNQVRDPAMSEVFGIKPNQLVQVMRRLREAMFGRDSKTEIVLMIEDFTLLQGVQYELLEAMLELPDREGEKVMCEMKAVIAVTRDRFAEVVAKNDTLRTRLDAQGHIYEIDLEVGAEAGALTEEQLVSFVGRYLNLVRTGPDAASAGKTPPNACHSCPLQDRCHPAFETDADGFGLYPFNPAFVANLAEAHRNQVNPRRILDALRRGLVAEAEAIRTGGFPSARFLAFLEPETQQAKDAVLLDFGVRDRIKEVAAKDAERRVGVQTWWTRDKDEVAQIDGQILEAFSLDEIDVASLPGPKPSKPQQDKASSEASKEADPINSWVNGDELPSGLAGSLRNHFSAGIVELVGGTSLLITAEELRRRFRPESIRIEGSAGGGRLAGAHEESFPRSPRNAVLFACATTASAGSLSGSPPDDVVRYTAELHVRARTVGTALERHRVEWGDDLDGRIRGSALFALSAGLAGGSEVDDLLAGIVDEVDEPRSVAEEWFPRVAGGKAALKAFRGERKHLLSFATGAKGIDRKSEPDPMSYDLAALLPPLEELCSAWKLSKSDVEHLPTRLGKALQDLPVAVDEVRGYLAEWLDRMGDLVGGPDEVERLGERLDGTERRAAAVGVGAGRLALSAEVRSELPDLVAAVAELLSGWDEASLGDRITGLLALERGKLENAREECSTINEALDRAIADAENRASVPPGQDPDALAGDVQESLKRLKKAAEESREHAA
jgi:hypothetical protein